MMKTEIGGQQLQERKQSVDRLAEQVREESGS